MPPSLHEPLLGTPTGDLGALRTFDTALTDARPLKRRVDLGVVPERGPVYLLAAPIGRPSTRISS